jgi:hypothetical protein
LLDGSEAVLYEGKRLRYVVLSEPAPRAECGGGVAEPASVYGGAGAQGVEAASGSSLAEGLEGKGVCDTIEAFGYVTFQTGN